jgi:hypothetical protein
VVKPHLYYAYLYSIYPAASQKHEIDFNKVLSPPRNPVLAKCETINHIVLNTAQPSQLPAHLVKAKSHPSRGAGKHLEVVPVTSGSNKWIYILMLTLWKHEMEINKKYTFF